MELQKQVTIAPALDRGQAGAASLEGEAAWDSTAELRADYADFLNLLTIKGDTAGDPIGIETGMVYIAIPAGVLAWVVTALLVRFLLF